MKPTSRRREIDLRLASALLAIAGMAGMSVASADLKPTAPGSVNLSALWKIVPELSDDPQKVVAKTRDDSMSGGRVGGGGTGSGGMGGGTRGGNNRRSGGIDAGDIFGGGTIGGTIGGGRGGGGSDRPEDDPAPRESMRVPLDSFLATREQFEIEQRPDALTVRTVDETSTCKPATSEKVAMPNGDSVDQRCGWQGSAFVIELKSPDGTTRSTRYELRKNDKQLVVISEIKGGRGQFRGLQIKRVYERLVAF